MIPWLVFKQGRWPCLFLEEVQPLLVLFRYLGKFVVAFFSVLFDPRPLAAVSDRSAR